MAAADLLEAVGADRSILDALSPEDRIRFLNAAANAFEPDVEARRRQTKARRRQEKDARLQREEDVLTEHRDPPAPAPSRCSRRRTCSRRTSRSSATTSRRPAPNDEQHCYVCKQKYVEIHHFYDQLCPPCAALNFAKRTETADLRGRVALLTGGRVKIGYQAGIKLLRAGASLIVTTRFPRDAALRYAGRPTSTSGATGSRSTGSTCGTRRASRRSATTSHDPSAGSTSSSTTPARRCAGRRRSTSTCWSSRRSRLDQLPAGARAACSAGVDGVRGARAARRARPGADRPGCRQRGALPARAAARGRRDAVAPLPRRATLDQDLQQVDLRDRNSWRLTLAEVSSVELLETQLVNAVAPFVLNARLKPLMLRTPERDKHIVNVSAVEGQFYRRFKTTRHPHTNMAKAALNMMTRTSAADYHADGIHMNSVDTGWVSDEDPVAHRRAEAGRAPVPPAARHRRRRRPHRRPDHRRRQHRAPTCGASSSRTTGPPTGSGLSARRSRRGGVRGRRASGGAVSLAVPTAYRNPSSVSKATSSNPASR